MVHLAQCNARHRFNQCSGKALMPQRPILHASLTPPPQIMSFCGGILGLSSLVDFLIVHVPLLDLALLKIDAGSSCDRTVRAVI